jgi:hypothetical protein
MTNKHNKYLVTARVDAYTKIRIENAIIGSYKLTRQQLIERGLNLALTEIENLKDKQCSA